MINALLTTAVLAMAMFPVAVVVHRPVGINVIWHPLVQPAGAVIVAIAVVPEINAMGVVTAMVVPDATVGTLAETLSGTATVIVLDALIVVAATVPPDRFVAVIALLALPVSVPEIVVKLPACGVTGLIITLSSVTGDPCGTGEVGVAANNTPQNNKDSRKRIAISERFMISTPCSLFRQHHLLPMPLQYQAWFRSW